MSITFLQYIFFYTSPFAFLQSQLNIFPIFSKLIAPVFFKMTPPCSLKRRHQVCPGSRSGFVKRVIISDRLSAIHYTGTGFVQKPEGLNEKDLVANAFGIVSIIFRYFWVSIGSPRKLPNCTLEFYI